MMTCSSFLHWYVWKTFEEIEKVRIISVSDTMLTCLAQICSITFYAFILVGMCLKCSDCEEHS